VLRGPKIFSIACNLFNQGGTDQLPPATRILFLAEAKNQFFAMQYLGLMMAYTLAVLAKLWPYVLKMPFMGMPTFSFLGP
jgi:hypothetical protein